MRFRFNRNRKSRNYTFLLSLFLLFFLFLAPFLATYDPLLTPGERLENPSRQHILGTDRLGRDVWSRWLIGGQRTLGAALFASFIAVGGGLFLAGLSISLPAISRSVVSIVIDALLAFPALLMALVILAALETGWLTLTVAVGFSQVAVYAKVARDALKAATLLPYIEGAYSIGARRQRILVYHLIPGALPTLAAFAGVIFSWALLYSAALSFLGLGGDSTQPDWGNMLAQSRFTMSQAPLLVVYPGIALAAAVWLVQRSANAFSHL